MKKIALSLVVLAVIFSSCGSKEEQKVESKTTITKGEDREDLKEENSMKDKGEEFLKNLESQEGFTKTASGLIYEVITEGAGDYPTAASTVKVHYTGMFIDNKVFDSSVERGEPIEFGLGQVIPGWTEGLQLMNKGAKYKLYIPYQLAYGPQGRPGAIPPFSALIFEVELLDF